jgi:hypothetical protein
MTMRRHLSLLFALAGPACVGTTGGEILEISASAAGPRDATGSSSSFTNSLGYTVDLDEARLFVGGVYLNRSRPTSVASDTSCTLPGIYVAEVLSGREVDLLSPETQAFREPGFATTERALTGEIWLAQGDVNEPSSSTVVLRVAGTASRTGSTFPFEGQLSIGRNRVVPATDPALPGQHPICKQRIVSPIPVSLLPARGGSLLLRIDPRPMFGNVDFETLESSAGVYRFADETGLNQASDNLYAGLRRSSGVYSLEWQEAP